MSGTRERADRAAVESILRARARRLAERNDDRETEVAGEELLIVAVGPLRCAVALRLLTRVAPLTGITPLPNAPPDVAGLAYLEGRIVTILDLGVVLGQARTRCRSVLLVEQDGEQLGFAVDEYLDVRTMSESEFSAPPAPLEGAAGRYLRGVTSEGVARLELDRVVEDALLHAQSPPQEEST